MIQIRQSVFETNSSSTHSITMCLKSDYDAWREGKLYLNTGAYSNSEFANKTFVTLEEAKDIILKPRSYSYRSISLNPEDINEEFMAQCGSEYSLYTEKAYDDSHDCLEWFDESFTTPSGEEIIAFGYFGYDG